MDSENSSVFSSWTDYTTGVWQIVVGQTTGYALPAFIAIWLSFSNRYIKRIIECSAIWARLKYNEIQLSHDPTETQPMIENNNRSDDDGERFRDSFVRVLDESGGGVRDLAKAIYRNRYKLSLGKILCLGCVTLFVILATIGTIVAGTWTSKVKITGAALLDSDKCGIWLFDFENAGMEAATRAGVLDLGKETRAGEYAQNCYDTTSTFDAVHCGFFYRRNIKFNTKYSYECPFHSDICAKGQQSVRFETGAIPASEIGVNSKKPYKFSRTMTCIPLSMEYPYVRNTTHEGLTTYYYYYGERIRREYDPPKSTSYTHNTSGDPFDSLAPVYEVHTYTTGLFEENSYWIPIPELAFPAHSTLSIMFISSLRILYLKRSADPLFPADKPKYLSDNQEPWFYNSDPRARPIACIDRTELYSPDGKQHWAMTENPSKDASKHPEYWLTLLSFLSSNMYDSVAKRLGSSFLAQKMVSQYQSHPLGDDHWVKEMKNIFATSLARAQIDTWSIASGEDSKHVGKDGYVPWTPDEAGNLCGLFKYRPSGHAYIKVIPFIGIILVLPFLFFVSRTMSEIKGWVCCGSRATKSSTPKELEPQAQLPSMNNNLSHALPEDGITEATEDEDTTRPEHSEEQQELADENEGEDLSLDGGQQNMTEESNDVPLRDLGDHTQRPADAIEGGLSDPYISSHGQARPGTFRSQEPSTHPPQAAAAVDLPAPRNSLWPSAMPSQPSQSKRRSKVHPDWELWEPLVIHIPFILIKRWLSSHPEENHSDESES